MSLNIFIINIYFFLNKPIFSNVDDDTYSDYDKIGYINFDMNTGTGTETVLVLKKNNIYYFKFYYDTVCYRIDGISDEYTKLLKPYTENDNLKKIYNSFKKWVEDMEEESRTQYNNFPN